MSSKPCSTPEAHARILHFGGNVFIGREGNDVRTSLLPIDATFSDASTVDEVCAWAALAAAEGGVGLRARNADVLRNQNLDDVTQARPVEAVLAQGSHERLLASIDRISRSRGVPGL